MSKGKTKPDLLQGTLDLMVLRTLETMGTQHGFGLAKRILQISDGLLDLNQGTHYPALLRLLPLNRWSRLSALQMGILGSIPCTAARHVRRYASACPQTRATKARYPGADFSPRGS